VTHARPHTNHDVSKDLIASVDLIAPGGEGIFPVTPELSFVAKDIIFGEGPVWDKRNKVLNFVDICGDNIWRWKPGSDAEEILNPSDHANGMTLDKEGRLVVCGWGGRTMFRFEKDGTLKTLATHFEGRKLNSPNDVVVKSDGTIYFTDPPGGLFNVGHIGMDSQRYQEVQPVFRMSPDGKELKIVTTDFVYPNGLCFSPDEKILYINCSRERVIRAYDVQPDGSVKNGRVFYKYTQPEHGNPDGIKCDVEGRVWCTGPGGIVVHNPNGNLVARLRMHGHATNFCFGGDDWKTLFITMVGSVTQMRVNVAGVASW
jgi:gluconolactonase